MNATQLELTVNELDDIIKQIPEQELTTEVYGDENHIDIKHFMIAFIDPIINVEVMHGNSQWSSENELTTPTKLTVTGFMCFDEEGDLVQLEEKEEEIITAVLNEKLWIADEVRTIDDMINED